MPKINYIKACTLNSSVPLFLAPLFSQMIRDNHLVGKAQNLSLSSVLEPHH